MKLAVISDVHEDIVSLRQALGKIEKKNCDEIICLGDISGFSIPHYHYYDTRNAHECLNILRENCKIIILGNHDINAAKKIPESTSAFVFPSNWYDLDYYEQKELSHGKLWLYVENELDPMYSNEDLKYLVTLPEKYIMDIKGMKLLFSHYVYPNITGLLKEFYNTPLEFQMHLDYMQTNGCIYSFAGHSHTKGLFIASHDKIIQKAFNRKYLLKEQVCIKVPSIASHRIGNGFCILDTDNFTVEAIRI